MACMMYLLGSCALRLRVLNLRTRDQSGCTSRKIIRLPPPPHFFPFSRSISVPTTLILGVDKRPRPGADGSHVTCFYHSMDAPAAVDGCGFDALRQRLQPAAGARYCQAVQQRQTR